MVELPKPDKRYKLGRIAKDKKGKYRGHPDTVIPKVMEIPKNAPLSMQLNPPLLADQVLVAYMEKKGLFK